jgi:hypothetical protein
MKAVLASFPAMLAPDWTRGEGALCSMGKDFHRVLRRGSRKRACEGVSNEGSAKGLNEGTEGCQPQKAQLSPSNVQVKGLERLALSLPWSPWAISYLLVLPVTLAAVFFALVTAPIADAPHLALPRLINGETIGQVLLTPAARTLRPPGTIPFPVLV